MGFFKFIENAQNKIQEKSENIAKNLGAVQKQIENDPNEMFSKVFKKSTETISSTAKKEQKSKSKVATTIIKKYYYNYPEVPYISDERGFDWIESAEMFPNQNIIPISMMTRYSDGLLPGHIYMLYWLKKYTNKKVPAYFEYKYGVDFEKEKIFLKNNGFLNEENKPTDKGEKAINEHYEVIEKHTPPKLDRSIEGISEQILKQRDSFVRNGFKEYIFIANSDCCDICKQLDKKHFKVSKLEIGVNAPPMHDGCRCSIASYSDREKYEKWLNSF